MSIYRANSELSRLNREACLTIRIRISSTSCDPHNRCSGGAFDVTIQPLWDLYAVTAALFARCIDIEADIFLEPSVVSDENTPTSA